MRTCTTHAHSVLFWYEWQELEQELEPKEAQIENLNQQMQEQDGELVEELKRASVQQPLLFGSQCHRMPCPVMAWHATA